MYADNTHRRGNVIYPLHGYENPILGQFHTTADAQVVDSEGERP